MVAKPDNARISTAQGQIYDPALNDYEKSYQISD